MIDWLLRPWLDNGGLAQRAGRVYLVAAVIAAAVLPGMMLYFGLDGWWWDTTVLVSVLAPAGIVAGDVVAARRGLGGLRRLAVMELGLLVGIAAGYLVVAIWREPAASEPSLASDLLRTLAILAPVVFLASMTGASLWYRADAYRLESAASAARYAVLEAQMQPHFLFNALASLKELIADDPVRASEATQRLAELYRAILRATAEPTAPLGDELAIVESYLEVERVRYGDRLRYRIDVADDLRAAHVPSLMLQTLAENAVKHGVCKARDGGEIAVRATRDGARVVLEVRNTGAPYVAGADGGTATGLSNTRARLSLLYGAGSRLDIGSEPSGATLVRFEVSGERVGR